MESEQTTETQEVEQKSSLHTVTSSSKYLAMVLFIVMPFIGGWVGYTYAPEKVVYTEESQIKKSESNFGFNLQKSSSSVNKVEGYDLVSDFSSSSFQVVSLIENPFYPNESKYNRLAIVAEKERGRHWGSCGGHHVSKKCYFFFESDFGVDPNRFIGVWESGSMPALQLETIEFLSSSTIQFKARGGDAGLEIKEVWSLDLETGSTTRIEKEVIDHMSEWIQEQYEAENAGKVVEEFACETERVPWLHDCFRLVDLDSGYVLIENLTGEAFNQGVITDDRAEMIELLYQSSKTNRSYLTVGIPGSSACCYLVEFDANSEKFTLRNDLYSPPVNSRTSKDKRFVVSVVDDGKTFMLADLEMGEIVYEEEITGGNLYSTSCDDGGSGIDFEFSADGKEIIYGVYSDKKIPGDNCDYQFIETRTYSVPL